MSKKLINNPKKVHVHRPGYKHFKLADLNLDIKSNPECLHNPKTHTYGGTSSHTIEDSKKRIQVTVVSIRKNNYSFIGITRNSEIALIPLEFPSVERLIKGIIETGKSPGQKFATIASKISRGKVLLTPEKQLVDSWFRIAGDPRVPRVQIINTNEIPEDFYIYSNVDYSFFKYLSFVTGLAIRYEDIDEETENLDEF